MDEFHYEMLLVMIYLFPSIVAALLERRSMWAILVLNAFFGWTVIGWFGALIWALAAAKRVEKTFGEKLAVRLDNFTDHIQHGYSERARKAGTKAVKKAIEPHLDGSWLERWDRKVNRFYD